MAAEIPGQEDPPRQPDDVTRLLSRCHEGDPTAEDELFASIYQHLRDMARGRMQGVPPTDTLQPTALVHEAWLRMAGRHSEGYQGRKHFYALASRAMHDIMVEQARRHGSQRRGGGWQRVDLGEKLGTSPGCEHDILALSEALATLKVSQPAASEVVLLRFFGGLTHEEIAQALELSVSSVRREWTYARAWLHQRLFDEDKGHSPPPEPG